MGGAVRCTRADVCSIDGGPAEPVRAGALTGRYPLPKRALPAKALINPAGDHNEARYGHRWNLLSGRTRLRACNFKTHTGIDVQTGAALPSTQADGDGNAMKGTTVWSIGKAGGDHFAPSKAPFVINYRVDDLDACARGVARRRRNVLDKTTPEYGKFGWVMDPGVTKVELWQPPAEQ